MSARISPFPVLAGAQADASHPRRQVWLSASAGTGKTQVLTARVLRLLLNGADPAGILCLTFTKAGAAEMSERVQTRLAAWVRLPDKLLSKELHALGERNDEASVRAARRLFARTLDAPGGGLRIQTIHAFAQALLAAFPAEAGLAPGFKPLDGRAEAALARSALGEMLVAAEAGADLGLIRDVQTLSRRLGEQAAESYLRTCARAPDALAALGPRMGIEARVRTALDLWLGDVEARIVEECHDDSFDCAGLRAIVAANRTWGTATGLKHAATAEAFLSAKGPERGALLEELILLVQTKDGSPRAISAKLLGCDPDHDGNCARLGEALAALLRQRRGAALAEMLAAGLRAGQAYAEAYARAKQAAGAVDFDDLIRRTTELLTLPGIGDWIRFKLDQRTDHILVDEGQDTNTRQWIIIRALAEEFFATDPEGADWQARTIFSVGDFKQAIFGFQGTDPQAFAAAREYFSMAAQEGRQQVERLSLDRSFRSTPPILRVVDALVAQLGGDALGLIDAPEHHVSAKPNGPGMVSLFAPLSAATDSDGDVAADDGEESWTDDATRAFATKLARQVKTWLDQPLWLGAKGRALRPEDILILVRKRGDLASLIVARLHAEAVPVAGVDRLRLDAPLAVRDLVAAIRFVLQPRDELALGCLLVSPLFGLSQDALYAIAKPRRGSLWEALQESGDHPEAVIGLRDLLSQADLTTPYRFLEHILSGPLDGRRRLMERLGGEARDPIEELLNAALAFEREATPSLQRFLDWFDRGEIEVTRDPSAPLDAVRVMTVHGAKGLQAPLVILADATGDPDRQRGGGIDWRLEEGADPVPVPRPRKDELPPVLAERIAASEARDREEHWRLLYVAVTRAEEYLVIGGALGPGARGQVPQSSWHAALDRALDGLGAEKVEDETWGHARHFSGDRPAGVAPARAAATPPSEPPRVIVLPGWLHRAAPIETLPPRPLAPSSIGDDMVADPPPGPAARAAARRGQLLHALFERLPAVPPEQRIEAATRWLMRSAGIEDEPIARGLAADACAIIADPAHAAIFGPDALAEAPIAAVVPGGHVIAGTVDRLVVEPGRVQVVDFKTGRRVPQDVSEVPVHYLRQMAAYVAALAVVFPDRPIEAALLYTAGPLLIPLAPALLEAHKPLYAPTQQILPLDG